MSHFNEWPREAVYSHFPEFHLPGWLSTDLEERQGEEPVICLLRISSNSTSVDIMYFSTVGLLE